MSSALSYKYQTGFGNEFATEAEPGALPIGRNSPQRAPLGLYTEKFSGTAFTAPKAHNRRSWFYRIRPSVTTVGFSAAEIGRIHTAPIASDTVSPDPLRWHPFDIPETPTDFVDGLFTMAVCGDANAQIGAGMHIYCANKSMTDRFFYDADGELLLVPQTGTLVVHSEFGVVEVPAGSIGVIPRGIRFRIELPHGPSRGYVCENYGAIFELPERGPIGSDCLANARDFEAPVASYEDRDGDFELVCKLGGRFFSASIGHSPLDVVAWHGNLYPYRYDLDRFNVIGSTSFDHPDPSIYTVLTSQSDTAGTANVDFVIFPPRWLVMENTFRPPWYHRNVMSEFMGLIRGEYDGKTSGGFTPGASSLHNSMVPHGPDENAFDAASAKELVPEPPKDTMAFMFESRYLIRPTRSALDAPQRQHDYPQVWQGLNRQFRV